MNTESVEQKKIWPWITWTYRGVEDYAYAIVRLSTGAILATHGFARLFGANPAFGYNEYLMKLPPSGVGAFELFGGFALALGFLTRPVALFTGLLWLFFTLEIGRAHV